MSGPQQKVSVCCKGCVLPWAVALFCLCATCGRAQGHTDSAIAWKQAVAAREAFEAEPVGQHTRVEYAQVMDRFRAIYHANPADLYAPRAVDTVAELLAEEGHELKDRKALHDAAGQYEFLAKGYPQSSLAAPGLAKALALLSPDEADDAGEARKVRSALESDYPRSAAARSAGDVGIVGAAEAPVTRSVSRPAEPSEPAPAAELVDDQRAAPGAAPAVVTGIRHWSTANYTRVAIDLGGDVEYKAARVENPDRIFFDLHGATLAKGLAGKTFRITDDGFLKSIRAGQFGTDVTRIVLDVQPVAEYSAFLLPNPTRLIIDIHGHEASAKPPAAPALTADARPAPAPQADEVTSPPQRPAAPASAPATSSLPPMAVTDGSAGFGLPTRHADAARESVAAPVARPRVVVSSHPTTARPVPNAVASTNPESSREVAAVSDGPGVIAANAHPTTRPVVDRSAASTDDDHYHPPSHRKTAPVASPETDAPANPAPPTADGQSTLMRALGLKIGRIVIDAGHGGHDSGTLGVGGIEEKNVVLDVALRLGKLLHDRLGAEVVYTRADDTFIPLETRTAIANKAQADLFISIHANSSPDADARGVEVYYLNFTSDPEAMRVAGRENAVSSQRVNQLSDLVKKIALKDKIDESRELAADVDQSLYGGLKKGNEGLKDRGVKKAPFVVLIGANMPSILAEISFVTNPEDAAELNRPEYRERVAESLYKGVASYAGAINGAGEHGRQRSLERAAR